MNCFQRQLGHGERRSRLSRLDLGFEPLSCRANRLKPVSIVGAGVMGIESGDQCDDFSSENIRLLESGPKPCDYTRHGIAAAHLVPRMRQWHSTDGNTIRREGEGEVQDW